MTAAPPLPIDEPLARQASAFPQWLRTHRGAAAMAGLLAFAGPVTFFTGALSVMRAPSAVDVTRLALWWMLYGLTLWCLLLVTGYGCERLARHCGRYLGPGIWLLGAIVAATVVNLLTAGRATILIEQGVVHSARTMHLHGFVISIIMALLYFAHLRRSREHERAAARLAAAQTAQRHARRLIVQSRLQEMQARIDPQLLFEMLETVRGLYERDAALAERFLDELTAFLRAALPRLRSASSSLLREVELARALMGLRAMAGGVALDMTIEVAPDAMHARFPPGVLLPLLDNRAGSSAGPCRLSAMRANDTCRLVLTLAAAPAQTAVVRVRSLLSEVYGTAGRVEIESTSTPIHVIVEVPHELA